MDHTTEKRKEKPAKRRRQMIVIGLVLICCALLAVVYAIATRQDDPPSDNSLLVIRPTYITAPPFPDLSLTLNLSEATPQTPINRGEARKFFDTDLAWGKPTFASSYDQDNYPSRATDRNNGRDMWRSASSTGTWLYVDLGKAKTFRSIASTLYVDEQENLSPETYYIVSDDLRTWRVVYDEVNADNQTRPIRLITLPEAVTARYVGLYGQNWGDGWADLTLFMIMP